eukprot:scaffold2713_cov24-Tisochrysis_lutea.AAC.3
MLRGWAQNHPPKAPGRRHRTPRVRAASSRHRPRETRGGRARENNRRWCASGGGKNLGEGEMIRAGRRGPSSQALRGAETLWRRSMRLRAAPNCAHARCPPPSCTAKRVLPSHLGGVDVLCALHQADRTSKGAHMSCLPHSPLPCNSHGRRRRTSGVSLYSEKRCSSPSIGEDE